MADDGTIGRTDTPLTPRQIVELYHYSLSSSTTPLDMYRTGSAILDKVDEVEVGVGNNTDSIAEIEEEIKPIMTLEQQMCEVQDVVAKMIFNLNELGIQFEFEQINNFRDKYLK